MKDLSLQARLLSAFLIVGMIIIVSGALSFRSVDILRTDIEHLVHKEIRALEITSRMELLLNQVSREIQTFLNPESSMGERAEAVLKIEQEYAEYRALSEEYVTVIESSRGHALFKEFEDSLAPWVALNKEIIDHNNLLMEMNILNPTALLWHLEESKSDYYEELSRLIGVVESDEEMIQSKGAEASAYWKWVQSYDEANEVVLSAIEQSKSTHTAFYETISAIENAITAGETEQARAKIGRDLLPLKNEISQYLSSIHEEIIEAERIYEEMAYIYEDKVRDLQDQTLTLLSEMVSNQIEENHTFMDTSIQHAETAQITSIATGAITLIGAVGFGFFFGRNLSRLLLTISERITESSDEARIASQEVANASSTLAEGASEQAASLEETSSAMEEMSSLIAKDTELAEQTAERALTAEHVIKSGLVSMTQLKDGVTSVGSSASELSKAMDGIKESGSNISKIIKTIDEIAFQTNILALNAAVEAARAGEAGAGFAVVADEVRNLAQRAAEAATETQSLIEESIHRSNLGVTLNTDVNANLQSVVELSGVVDECLNQISSEVGHMDSSMSELKSSVKEQREGMTQINGGVLEINEVTQSSAASAEEAASASEQLAAQAESLSEVVDELNLLVKGKGRRVEPAMRLTQNTQFQLHAS